MNLLVERKKCEPVFLFADFFLRNENIAVLPGIKTLNLKKKESVKLKKAPGGIPGTLS
jgi:hypothetical protein